MRDRNRQLRFTRQHDFVWTEVESPAITERSSAIVRPLLVARSDADVSVLFPKAGKQTSVFHLPDPLTVVKSRFDNLSKKIPLPRRHASAGVGQQGIAEVVQVGPDVSSIKPGQLVILMTHGGAGGLNVGELTRFDAAPGWLSDLVLVADASTNLQQLPEELDPFQMAAAGGDLLSAWNAVEPLANTMTNPSVLVTGGTARNTALYSVALATSFGPEKLDYLDYSGERVAIAKQLGANAMEVDFRRHRSPLPPRYNLVVSGSSERHAVNYALQQLLPGGQFVQLAPQQLDGVKIPLSLLYEKRLSVAMSAEPSNARLQGLLAYLLKRPLDLSSVLTHRGDFQAAETHLIKDTTGVVLYRAGVQSRRSIS